MHGTRLRTVILILLSLSLLFGGTLYAAHWSAWRLGYAPWLGAPVEVLGVRVYTPVQYGRSYIKAHKAYPWAFTWPNQVIVVSAGLSMLGILGTKVWARRDGAQTTTFGSSRWATRADIKEAGLL